jgi:hypothetical protein
MAVGWRVAFGLGALLGLCLTIVRRKVPENPRWLFIHGREEQAEQIGDKIEHDIEAETGQDLAAVSDSITVGQRKAISFREIARVAFKTYPKRSIPVRFAVRRPSVSVQRRHLQPRHADDQLLRHQRRNGAGVHHHLRARELPGTTDARAAV